MNDKIQKPEMMTLEDFQEMSEGLAQGIDLLLKASTDNEVNYVLCLNHTGLEQMGVVTNASPFKALHMIMSVSKEMDHELNKTKCSKNKIVLPH